MRRQSSLFASTSLLLALIACSGGTRSEPGPGSVSQAKSSLPRDAVSALPASAVGDAVAANNAFAVDLYAHLRETEAPGNLLTSPLSASLALTMTYAGAVGDTRTQMATALHLGGAAGSIFDGQNALSQALASRAAAAFQGATHAPPPGQPAPVAEDYQLQVVNSVWGEKSYTWEAPFLDTLARSYGTGVYQEDFVHSYEQARLAINGWVSDETANKIQNLLGQGALDDSTRMVLVNAVHLKFPWLVPFKVEATAPGTFTKGDGTTVSTPFMNQTGELGYEDDGQAQKVSLPLAGGSVSVVLAMPHGDLASYEAALAAGSGALVLPSQTAEIALSLPKVSFTSPTYSLSAELKAMGMPKAFDGASADFSGLSAHPPDGERLYIGEVYQKTMIAMNEGGVEAAAATAVAISAGSALPPPPVPVILDRPFVLAILDVPTGAVLFVGHIVDPTAAAGQ